MHSFRIPRKSEECCGNGLPLRQLFAKYAPRTGRDIELSSCFAPCFSVTSKMQMQAALRLEKPRRFRQTLLLGTAAIGIIFLGACVLYLTLEALRLIVQQL